MLFQRTTTISTTLLNQMTSQRYRIFYLYANTFSLLQWYAVSKMRRQKQKNGKKHLLTLRSQKIDSSSNICNVIK